MVRRALQELMVHRMHRTRCVANSFPAFPVRATMPRMKWSRQGPLCVDIYEASVWDAPVASAATHQYGVSGDEYPCNDNGNDCSGSNPIYARSIAGVTLQDISPGSRPSRPAA